jgi:hypothetical protein
MAASHRIIRGENKDIILVSFAGQGMGIGTLPQFEFVNFLNKHFPQYEKHFYLDIYKKWYHRGIDGISKNIPETKEYLQRQIQGYKKVVFIGSSSGGYAAILFGSLLNVDSVLAFIPQTILPYSNPVFQMEYGDLRHWINATTEYNIYGDLSATLLGDPYHHVSHCLNIEVGPNVHVFLEERLDLKKWRDNGKLSEILGESI